MARWRFLFAIVAGFALELFQFFHHETRSMQNLIQASFPAGDMNVPQIKQEGEQPNNGVVIVETQPPPQQAAAAAPEGDNTGQTNPPATSAPPPAAAAEGENTELANRPATSLSDADVDRLLQYRRQNSLRRQESITEVSRNVAAMIAKRAGANHQITRLSGAPGKGFEPAKIDYQKGVVSSDSTKLPPPIVTNQTTVIIVMSATGNFERRAAIRETWSKQNDNVYFIVGGIDPANPQQLDRNNPQSVSSRLWQEQKEFGDIIDSVRPDSYRSLPYKLHFAMQWVYNNVKDVEWVVKADDDQVVRVKRLQFFVLRNLNPSLPMVLGMIAVGGRPHRQGKWAEDPKFKGDVYPPWPFGSAGYVVSRPVVEYIAMKNDLYYYQGEDAGLGIWLNESPLQVVFLDTPELRKDKGCQDQFYIIGHDLDSKTIRDCFAKLGDGIPERKHIISYTAARKDQHPYNIRNHN